MPQHPGDATAENEGFGGDGSDSISANDAVAWPVGRPIQLVISRFRPSSVLRRRRLRPLHLKCPARPRQGGVAPAECGWLA